MSCILYLFKLVKNWTQATSKDLTGRDVWPAAHGLDITVIYRISTHFGCCRDGRFPFQSFRYQDYCHFSCDDSLSSAVSARSVVVVIAAVIRNCSRWLLVLSTVRTTAYITIIILLFITIVKVRSVIVLYTLLYFTVIIILSRLK